MNFVVANPTGLCFGVRRAIGMLEEALGRYGEVYSLGSPIHNPPEVERLVNIGLKIADCVSDVTEGSAAFIRAHGISRAERDDLNSRAGVVVDGTCPFVRIAHERAESLSKEGYRVVVLGDPEHPEVRGILGYINGEYMVISSEEEIGADARYERLGILSQTTQREATFAAAVSRLVLQSGEIKVYNTICRATIERQESIMRMSAAVDGVIVLGGRNSANTRKLVEIAESLGVPTLWIERSDEVDWGWLSGRESIGVAAGGSTPDWLIKDLTGKLKRL
ncbi:MAG: 4-hydroxy-3-methylbut-2-enyl diphosphate reductase [Synergistaceae bacterium]|jgi:4-hydroxy-3-methylbut-2-enyl diphosphate reductase|nr:4-hydroxy-3-methylbut-2-enyl diphosphate reductase [Synergistaceae bacterium]